MMIQVSSVGANTVVWQAELPDDSTRRLAVLPGPDAGSVRAFVPVGRFGHPYEVFAFDAGPGRPTDSILRFSDPDYDLNARSFGYAIANAGDVDGDGFEDLLVSARFPSDLYLYRGGPEMDTTPDFHLSGSSFPDLDNFAWTLAGNGDLNADGYSDFAVGFYENGISRAYVYFGGPALDTEPDVVLSDVYLNRSQFSFCVMNEDVDGDGHDDLVSTDRVQVRIYAGGSDFDGQYDYSLGPQPTGLVSLAVGDVDTDGHADVLFASDGSALIYHGGPEFDPTADGSVVVETHGLPLTVPWSGRIELGRRQSSGPMGAFVSTLHSSVVHVDVEGANAGRVNWIIPYPNDQIIDAGDVVTSITAGFDINENGFEEFIVADSWAVRLMENPFLDCDGNDVPDEAQIAAGELVDCDSDGIADACQVNVWTELDCNRDDVVDACQLDGRDCDENGILDACDLAADWNAIRDCDRDQVLDVCDPVHPDFDLDGNGIPDCREIHNNPGLDCNRDGVLDRLQVADTSVDCDGNGTRDLCEMFYEGVDCNDDLSLDRCQVDTLVYDCDRDGNMDVCATEGELGSDCDDDGRADVCEIHSGAVVDCNANGFLDTCEGLPESSPCFSQPFIGVYFDEAHEVDAVTADDLAQTGDLYVVLRNVDPSQATAIDRFEFRLGLPEGLSGLEGLMSPPSARDFDSGRYSWYVQTNGPLSVDSGGDVQLLHLPFWVTGPPDEPTAITIEGAEVSLVSTNFPVFHDVQTGEHRVLDARAAWIGREFEDCNHNAQSDSLDIAEGRSADGNGDGIPDECQVTATPVNDLVFGLHPGSPNPFNPRTTISFTLPTAMRVELAIYDVSGRLVRSLVSERAEAGEYRRVWDGTDEQGMEVGSGVYLVRLASAAAVLTRKVALLR